MQSQCFDGPCGLLGQVCYNIPVGSLVRHFGWSFSFQFHLHDNVLNLIMAEKYQVC